MIDSLHVKLIPLLYDKIFFKFCKVKNRWWMRDVHYLNWYDCGIHLICVTFKYSIYDTLNPCQIGGNGRCCTRNWSMFDKSFVSFMPVHVWWRLESQNLHRHQKNQKNQTTRCKNKVWASTQGWGSIDCKLLFFLCFFDACAGFVKIMLWFFLVFLMPVHVWWRLESQNLHRHQKNQTTRCT